MAEDAKSKSDWSIYRRLLGYVGHYWPLLIVAFVVERFLSKGNLSGALK